MTIFNELDIGDLLAIIGIVLVSYGAWMIYPPAAFIVPGIVLLLIGVIWKRGGSDGTG